MSEGAKASDRAHLFCCADFRAAYEVTFANPIDGAIVWILYGTDHDTVSVGQPELRYWPIRYCPLCGALLEPWA
jgi:hypothetical protein